jgi:hypothetical protein
MPLLHLTSPRALRSRRTGMPHRRLKAAHLVLAGKVFRPIGAWIANPDPKVGTVLGRKQIDKRHLPDRALPGVGGATHAKYTTTGVPGWLGVSAAAYPDGKELPGRSPGLALGFASMRVTVWVWGIGWPASRACWPRKCEGRAREACLGLVWQNAGAPAQAALAAMLSPA